MAEKKDTEIEVEALRKKGLSISELHTEALRMANDCLRRNPEGYKSELKSMAKHAAIFVRIKELKDDKHNTKQ